MICIFHMFLTYKIFLRNPDRISQMRMIRAQGSQVSQYKGYTVNPPLYLSVKARLYLKKVLINSPTPVRSLRENHAFEEKV